MFLAFAIEMLSYSGFQHHHADSTKLKIFKSHFGASPLVVQELWEKMTDNGMIQRHKGVTPSHLLWCLHFLFVYPSETVGSATCQTSRSTYRKWVWKVIGELELLSHIEVRS